MTVLFLLRCSKGHEVEASRRLTSCPHGSCGQDLERIKSDGTRHPKQEG